MGTAQRAHERYRIELSVDLVVGKRRTSLATEDVSFSGMFLRTAAPPPLRGLVRLDVPIADEDRTLTLHAMVVHVLKPDNPWGRPPGIGLRFYGIDRDHRAAWVAFVNRFKDAAARRGAGAFAASMAVVDGPAPSALEPERYAAVLEVQAPSTAALEAFVARDVPRGRTFLRTELELDEGAELFVELFHPDTHELFGLKSRVVRRVAERGNRGVVVELLDVDAATREQLWSFAHTAMPLEDDDVPIFEDSSLWSELSPETLRAAATMGGAPQQPGGL